MTPEQLDGMLRAWGRHYGERPEVEQREDIRAPDVHPLAVGMRFAPGDRATVALSSMRRGGQSRRKLMAVGLESCGVRIVPADYVDPMPCTGGHGGGSSEARIAPLVEAVQTAWLALFRLDEACARVVQTEYQRRAMTQRDKAVTLGMKLWRYRLDLEEGKIWMKYRLAE